MRNKVQYLPTTEDQTVAKTPEAPKQKSCIVIGLTVLSLLLLGTTVFFAYQNYQLKQQIQQKPPISPRETTKQPETSSSTPTITPTSGWETYLNNYGKYSFKYPNNWFLESSTDTTNALDNPSTNNVLGSELKYGGSRSFNNRVSITVNKVSSQNNLAKAKDILLSWKNNEAILEDVTLEGASGYKLIWSYSDPAGSASRIDYRFENNGLLYEIELSVNNKTPNKQAIYDEGVKILSTLKFTDQL